MKISSIPTPIREVLFQLVLHMVVFVFYSFDKFQPRIEEHNVVFFLIYALAAFFINYLLLPRFYYRKRYLLFTTGIILTIAALIFIEEKILEPIYFPGARAQHFPGLLFTLVEILPVVTILVGFKFAWDALLKQREVDDLKTVIQESELQFLKSQINPHFLFNNLNNLYSYAIDNSPKTPEIILELSGVLRYMLYECREKYVPLHKELSQLENFVNLNELQIEERGEVHFSASDIPAGYQIAPLILIVFIENAFKHSTTSQSDKILIDIQIDMPKPGLLYFLCKNSYQPQSNTESLSHGIGLANVNKRLQLIYPNAHQLDISKSDNLYEVHLSIDLKAK